MSAEWSFTGSDGTELRVMRLPDRKALYLILTDEDGMHCVARTLGDREATALVSFLDSLTAAVRDVGGSEGLRVGQAWGRAVLEGSGGAQGPKS